MDLSDHREGRICRLSAMKAADKVTQTPAVIEDTASQWCTADTRIATGAQDLKAAISAVDDATLCDIANTAFLKLALKHGIDTNPADFVSLSNHSNEAASGKKEKQPAIQVCLLHSKQPTRIRCSTVPIRSDAVWASGVSN